MSSAYFYILNNILNSKNHEIIKSDIGLLEYKDGSSDKIKSHKFINSMGIGFDAKVGKLQKENENFTGILSYLIAVIKALFNYKMIDLSSITLNNEIVGEKLMISIGNGKCSGGGFYLNPDALIDDGYLDISIFDKISRRRLVTALPMALLNKLHKVPEVTMEKADSLEIELKNPYYVHCDGEIVTDSLVHGKISIIRNAVNIIKL